MRACRYHAPVGKTPPRLDDVPVPEPAPGELLVRVRCASLNPVDWKLADGKFHWLVRGGMPRTMGSDFSGEVAAVGPGVDAWAPGEPVMGFIDPFARAHGTFAEFVPVPVEFAFRRPAPVDDVLGAALPCVGVTAVALCDLARVTRGSRVLVNGAAGGVGHMAVQVAKARGAHVTATASARRRALVDSLGADAFVDYATEPVQRWPAGFGAVLDCVPNLPRRSHGRLLGHDGHYASTLPNAWTYTLDPLLNRLGRFARHAVMLQPSESAIAELLRDLDQGKLHCEIAGEFPLEDAAQAIELSRAGHVSGKLVIRIA
jgi:NADPH:quinone reductase-like Zn-dependent oxidoreductase